MGLVDAVEDEAVELDEIEESALPPELQNKTKAEIEQYVIEKKADRDQIQSQIQELNKKRAAFIKEKKKGQGTNLESAMIEALKKQARKKNYTWDN